MPTRSRRTPDYVQKGQHQALIPWELFEACQQLLKHKGHNTNSTKRPSTIYELSGIARCWHCKEQSGLVRSFRGSTNNHGKRYYRCATNLDFYAKRRSQKSDVPPPIAAGVKPVESSKTILAPCPNQSLRAEVLEEQVAEVISRLVIPTAWYEESLAYFLSEEGMSEFERKRSNLAQGIYHAAELLKSGIITRAEFEAEKSRFEERLARLRPSVQAEAQLAAPLLHDFAALWRQMTPDEHKGMLQCMLVGVYFDGLELKHVIANEPFDQLLGLSE